jgi:hypothetical protein
MTWLGIEHLGYVEFGVAGRMFMEGAFRRLLNCNIALQTFENNLRQAQTPDDCWSVIQGAGQTFGFPQMQMLLAGRKYESPNGLAASRLWTIRIPISDWDYLELKRAFDNPVQTAAVAPFADILRNTLEPKLTALAWRKHISARAMTAEALENEMAYSATASQS